MNLNLNHIQGCLFGYAIGNALGLGTEFMTAPEAAHRYPGGLRHYDQIIRDAHRSQWKHGDFTMDTEILLRLAHTITDHGYASVEEFARMLTDWYEEFPYDFEGHFRWVVSHPDFTKDPIDASRQVWEGMGRYEAYNEALGRAMLLGLSKEDHRQKIADNCRTTHYDPRCVCTAVVIGEVSHQLMWHGHRSTPEELINLASEWDTRCIPLIKMAAEGDLAGMDLDDKKTYWWTRKAMASALWAFWHAKDAEEALFRIVDEAGDADTNAALALGLYGLREGVEALPQNLLDGLVQKERVGAKAQKVYDTLCKL